MLFFSEGRQPCGLFSATHLITMTVCFFSAWLGAYLSRSMKKTTLLKLTKILAVVITLLEIGKIAYNFYYGYYNPNQWLPLWYCSIFIYCLWMVGFGRGIMQKVGALFITGGGILAGAFFLILPLTSVTSYPMFHFLSCYSMFYHTMMHYLGLTYLGTDFFRLTLQDLPLYALFIAFFCFLGIIVNGFFDSNLMFINDPYNIPVPLLRVICDRAKPLYMLIIYCAYTFGLYLPTYGVYSLLTKNKMRNELIPQERRS